MKLEVDSNLASALHQGADELSGSIENRGEVKALVDLERLIPAMEALTGIFKLIASSAGYAVRSATPVTRTMTELKFPKDNGTTVLLRVAARLIGKPNMKPGQIYLGELIQLAARDLENKPQVGRPSVAKMQDFLRSLGYDFGMTLDPQQKEQLESVNGWIREDD